MAHFNLYLNLSGYSFYKTKIKEEIGINSLLVFNIDGIPFITRDYSDDQLETSKDYIYLSAFISSILKFIKVEGKSYITDFGIGTSRYYLKFDVHQTVYCLILNEIIHRRITGEQLVIFVELALNDVKKLFNTFYVQSDGQLGKPKYDEQFCLRLDKLFIQNFEITFPSENGKKSLIQSKDQIDFNIKLDSSNLLDGQVEKKLISFGIKGLLICGLGGDIPIILRNYDKKNEENVESSYFFCGLSNLLNKFALANFGFFTDVGFGYKRVMFKFKTQNNLTLCLILSEILFRRLTGETLNMFSDLTLKGIHKSIQKILPSLKELTVNDIESKHYNELSNNLDWILQKNANFAINELS